MLLSPNTSARATVSPGQSRSLQFIKCQDAALDQVFPDQLQTVPRGLVNVQIEIGQGHDGFREFLQVFPGSSRGIPLADLKLLDVPEGIVLLMIVHNRLEVVPIALAGSQSPGPDYRGSRIVLGPDGLGGETGESVESNDLPVSIEGLINAAEGGEKGHVLPRGSELDDDAGHLHDLFINMLHKEHARKVFGIDEKAEVVQDVDVGDGALFERVHKFAAELVLLAASV